MTGIFYVLTRGWNEYKNKSQHRKLTLEKKVLLPLLQGFEPTTFQSRIWCSNHWANPAPSYYWIISCQFNLLWSCRSPHCAHHHRLQAGWQRTVALQRRTTQAEAAHVCIVETGPHSESASLAADDTRCMVWMVWSVPGETHHCLLLTQGHCCAEMSPQCECGRQRWCPEDNSWTEGWGGWRQAMPQRGRRNAPGSVFVWRSSLYRSTRHSALLLSVQLGSEHVCQRVCLPVFWKQSIALGTVGENEMFS